MPFHLSSSCNWYLLRLCTSSLFHMLESRFYLTIRVYIRVLEKRRYKAIFICFLSNEILLDRRRSFQIASRSVLSFLRNLHFQCTSWRAARNERARHAEAFSRDFLPRPRGRRRGGTPGSFAVSYDHLASTNWPLRARRSEKPLRERRRDAPETNRLALASCPGMISHLAFDASLTRSGEHAMASLAMLHVAPSLHELVRRSRSSPVCIPRAVEFSFNYGLLSRVTVFWQDGGKEPPFLAASRFQLKVFPGLRAKLLCRARLMLGLRFLVSAPSRSTKLYTLCHGGSKNILVVQRK